MKKGGEEREEGEKKVVENSLLLLSNLSCFQKSFAGKRKKGKRRERENLFRQFWVQRRRGKGWRLLLRPRIVPFHQTHGRFARLLQISNYKGETFLTTLEK